MLWRRDIASATMGEIVSLRKHRKRLQRAAAEQQAAENRARFGRPKAERRRDVGETEQRSRSLDGKRIEKPETDENP